MIIKLTEYANKVRDWFASRDILTKRNGMYAAATIALVCVVLALVFGSGWLWFTVGAQGYLLAFGTADDWRT